LRLTPEQVAAGAAQYAVRMISHSFTSEREIRALVTESGLFLDSCRVREVPGEMASTLYCEFVAHRGPEC